MDWRDMTPEEARNKMIAAMRLDAEEGGEGEEEQPQGKSKGGHGNTRLPYGLCKRFGIDLPDDATPREAWAALEKGTGYSHDEVMDIVKKVGDTKSMKEKKSGGGVSACGGKKTTPKCEATSLGEVQKYISDNFGIKSMFNKNTTMETANLFANTMAENIAIAPKIKNSVHCCGSFRPAQVEMKNAAYPIWKGVVDRLYPDAWEQARVREANKLSLFRKPKDSKAFYGARMINNINPDVGTAEEIKAISDINDKYKGVYMTDVESSSEYTLKYEEKTSWCPKGCGNKKAVIDHEMGHAIDHAYDLSHNKRITDYIYGKSSTEIAKGLSEYAVDDSSVLVQETIAEAWAEYRNNPEPRPIAKEIGDMIMDIIKEDGGKQ